MSSVSKRGPAKSSKGPKLSNRQKKEVKNLIGRSIEVKSYNTGFGHTAVSSSPSFTVLSAVDAGPESYERIGDSITLKRLTVRMQFTGEDTYNTVRAVLFRYKQDNSVGAPTATQLFDATASGSIFALCPVPNRDQDQKIEIIWDKVVTLPRSEFYTGSTVLMNNSASVRTWQKTFYGRRLGPKKIRFNPGGVTTGFGHIYLCVVSDSSPLTGHPHVYLNAKLEYADG